MIPRKIFFTLVFLLLIFLFFYVLTRSAKQLPLSLLNPSSQNNIPNNISTGGVPNIPFKLPPGFTIHIFAANLGTPRALTFSPDGTLLVSDPNSNKVIALPDKNNDGIADIQKVVVNGGNNIHGLAFYGEQLFVAETNRVGRYNWSENSLSATFDKALFNLPSNNNHNLRTMAFDNVGNLFVSVGSTCNICAEKDNRSATVMLSNANGDNSHVFATGLRNAAFIAINPQTQELWGTEMGRDYLGDNLPPDEINIIREAKNYGWPYCYGNKVHDNNFDSSNAYACQKTEPAIYEIPSHSAPLGLVFINSPQLPADWQGDLLVAYHGSWNRSTPIGYKIVHLKVNGNTIVGSDDFLTGFLAGDDYNSVLARPVGLAFDKAGNLYVSDDKAGNVYIIQRSLEE